MARNCFENFELKILSEFKLNKPKMVRFFKIKFLTILKLKYNVGQFYTKILNFDYFKKMEILHKIKFDIKNGEHLR